MVKNLPPNAGDVGLIPDWGTKIPHAVGQLSPPATTTELTPSTREPTCANYRVHALWSPHTTTRERKNTHTTTREKPVHQQKILDASTKTPHTATKDPTQPNK